MLDGHPRQARHHRSAGLMAYEALESSELAAIVTFLEMRQPPREQPGLSELRLRRIDRPSAHDYRALFRRVGERWLWFSRLIMSDEELLGIIHDPKVEIHVVEDAQGSTCGMLELDFREERSCELAFVGLVPELAGKGLGRWLLAEAVARAWRTHVERVHVHTCSLDHPAALASYRRAGFRTCRRAIERFPDPRHIGVLPEDCAPQIPLLGTESSGEAVPER